MVYDGQDVQNGCQLSETVDGVWVQRWANLVQEQPERSVRERIVRLN